MGREEGKRRASVEKLLLDIIIFLNVDFELFLKCPEMGCQHFCLKELRLVRVLDMC